MIVKSDPSNSLKLKNIDLNSIASGILVALADPYKVSPTIPIPKYSKVALI